MKTRIITTSFAFLFALPILAQDRTTVNAMSSEISDNLDLRAIASIFGDSRNLEDFEQRLNDPNSQISNLDLNEDNKVDYLRVIESVEGNTHLIVVQSVLGRDIFQDVATIEVERDRNNKVQVQVVGDVYMYGQNYIYEPVYVATPVIYSTFWTPRYRPYCSVWYWDYYPTYYYAWNPFPVFRYRNHISIHINFNNHYDYVTTRRCARAVVLHQPIRANYCERTYPKRAFAYRNTNYGNRYELDRTRNVRTIGNRNDFAYNQTRGNGRYNTPIKQSTRNGSEAIGRNTESNSIGRSTESNPRIKTDRVSGSEMTGRTRTESNPRIRINSDSDSRPNSNERTRYENTRTNAGVKSPTMYNESRGRERVSNANSRPEGSNNGRENNTARSERGTGRSNDRTSRG